MKAELYSSHSISTNVINFFIEDINYQIDFSTDHINNWLQHVAQQNNLVIETLSFILCSDTYLLDINRRFLDHDYFTDIITFDNSDTPGTLEGDVFISIDRVLDNATSFNSTFHEELFRVIIHGLLHLIGFDDKSSSSQTLMREMENKYLHLYFNSFEH